MFTDTKTGEIDSLYIVYKELQQRHLDKELQYFQAILN